MSRILFTWELGANLGHLGRYLPIARQLGLRGHEVLFAIRNQSSFSALIFGNGFSSVQAPLCSTLDAATGDMVNYADILAMNGFGSADQLSGLMDGWSSIFQEFRPDLITAQSAPSSLLAAHLARIPAMRVDCGFGCPPDEAPFPSFRPWLDVSREGLLTREQHVLEHINQVCSMYQAPAFATIQDVFRTDTDLLLTVPELDHYTGRRNGRYIGPINAEEGEVPAWPDGSGRRIFVYLRPFKGLPEILDSLSSSNCNVIAVLPGIDDELCSTYSSPSFRISKAPVRILHMLSETDIAITHGGHGVASASLLAGVPMLLVPQVAEQLMTVYNFERLGVGKGVKHHEVAGKFKAAFKSMQKDHHYRQNAMRLSRKYAGFDQEGAIRQVCLAIEEKAKIR
jgi:UDP:flavonoid glycosyltransferase YjiC (YdhE family)